MIQKGGVCMITGRARRHSAMFWNAVVMGGYCDVCGNFVILEDFVMQFANEREREREGE